MGANEEKGGACGTIFLKYLLFTFNFLFWLAGGVVMGVGVWTLVEKSEYISLLPSKTYAASAYILVLAGAIVMVTGVLGCCATFKEQRRLLRVVREALYTHTHAHTHLYTCCPYIRVSVCVSKPIY
ncbi:CD151 antigen-like [Gadus macrocephalus]|uniref:CD151 antigen-like n=1 Tax=Gadus macrocephalus TaxID=80720 RepID=UPI0028CB2322|nr:CD151 antigen-like [Gadus macrocephalus]